MTPITIGMAVFDDLQGAWFSVHSLLMYHHADLAGCELLLIHNRPGAPVSDSFQKMMSLADKLPGLDARYVPAGEIVGTSYPRDRLFREATREAVLCLDAHVLVTPGSLCRLRAFYEENPDCRDLMSGPMLNGRHQVLSTHFNDVWSMNMWGTWGRDPRSDDPEGEPFEIPAMGLGLFTCRKDAWLGFNPDCRGFGGEEWYIHQKYRQAGWRALCLPWLRWLHYFGGLRGGRGYPLRQWDRVRNYVLELRELGLPLNRVHRHFVEGQPETRPNGKPADRPTTIISERAWQYLLADPVNHTEPPGAGRPAKAKKKGGCGKARAPQPPPSAQEPVPPRRARSLEELYLITATQPSDINEHIPKLRELASQSRHVTEFGVRTARSSVGLLAGQPEVLRSYDTRRSPIVDRFLDWAGRTDYRFHQADVLEVDIEPTDLLFIDTRHTAAQLYKELARHAGKVGERIVLHDTQIFGERGEDGGPGLLAALRQFLREHPEWSVIYHVTNNHGLTVISRTKEDRPPLPPLGSRIKTFGEHAWDHLKDKLAGVSKEVYNRRLDICALCNERNNRHCSKCGCPILEKASWRSSYCDLGNWTGDLVLVPPSKAGAK